MKRHLRLADGQAWVLEAESGMAPWLEEMASIMGLTPNGSAEGSRIRVVEGDLRESRLAKTADEKPTRPPWKSGLWDGETLDLGLIRFKHQPLKREVVCEAAPTKAQHQRYTQMRLFVSVIYLRALERGGVPLHAGLVEREARGVVLAAPGNTGKSTCCRRIPYPWQAVCDDESLVVLNGGKYAVHPFPTWSEYVGNRSTPTWNTQRHTPLKAIFCLERGERDEAIPMGQAKGAVQIAGLAREEVLPPWMKMNPADKAAIRRKLFENACRLVSWVPVYRLRATLDGEFWKEIDRVLESL